MNSSLVESSTGIQHFIEFQELQPLHCSKDALTDFFGWLLQGLLAAIAFSCLIGEWRLSTNYHHNRIKLTSRSHCPRLISRRLIQIDNFRLLFQLRGFASPATDAGHGIFGGTTPPNKESARWSSTWPTCTSPRYLKAIRVHGKLNISSSGNCIFY